MLYGIGEAFFNVEVIMASLHEGRIWLHVPQTHSDPVIWTMLNVLTYYFEEEELSHNDRNQAWSCSGFVMYNAKICCAFPC